MSARDVIADWIHFEASIQNGFENSRGKSVNDHADDILSALRSAGWAVVPVEPTNSMELAASEHDMNEIEVMRKIWRAMLSASEGEP